MKRTAVVKAPLTSPSPEFHLVPLEVGLILHHFYKTLREQASIKHLAHNSMSTVRTYLLLIGGAALSDT